MSASIGDHTNIKIQMENGWRNWNEAITCNVPKCPSVVPITTTATNTSTADPSFINTYYASNTSDSFTIEAPHIEIDSEMLKKITVNVDKAMTLGYWDSDHDKNARRAYRVFGTNKYDAIVEELRKKQSFFLIVNLVDIFDNAFIDVDPKYSTRVYTYKKNNIMVAYAIEDCEWKDSVTDMTHIKICCHIVMELAKKYTEAYFEHYKEETKIEYNYFNEFARNIARLGGGITVETYEGDCGNVRIDIPFNQLHNLKVCGTPTPGYDFLCKDLNVGDLKTCKLPAVSRVDTYNDRVVKVTFMDGTFTKSVCSENDKFDLDVGISICLAKRMLRKDTKEANKVYNNLMRDIHKRMEELEKRREWEKEQKLKEKELNRKENLKKAAKNLKRKQEQIVIQKTAIIEALREDRRMTGDDGK